MTSVEIMSSQLGDAFIDLIRQEGVGLNACSIRDLLVDGKHISFHLDRSDRLRIVKVKFAGVDVSAMYSIACNSHKPQSVEGAILAREGYTIEN